MGSGGTGHPRRGAKDRRFIRQWQLVSTLAERRRGATVRELAGILEVSEKTVRRELHVLDSGGVRFQTTSTNGTVRWRLDRECGLPALGLSALQVALLGLARVSLEPLAGTTWVREIDALLASVRQKGEQLPLRFPAGPPGNPAALAAIERAMRLGVRLHVDYRSVARRGAVESTHVEPLLLNVAHGTPYLLAHSVERGAQRTYRLSRIVKAEVTAVRAVHQPGREHGRAFEHSVKSWTGEPTHVRVRLSPRVAWLAGDFPLVHDQTLEPAADGSVVVSATTAGTTEALRWVLGWGGEAEALEPRVLRDAVANKLSRALSHYRPVRKATPAKTRRDTNAVRVGE